LREPPGPALWHAGPTRRVIDGGRRMPYGLDVVLMQVVHECGVVPLGVLRPHAGLAPNRGTVRDRGLEERVYLLPTFGGERNMSRRGDGLPLADREVVQVLGPVADTVFLGVKFHVPERSQGRRIESPARVKVFDHEEHVIDDDPALGYALNPTFLVPFALRNQFEFGATTPAQSELRNGFTQALPAVTPSRYASAGRTTAPPAR
jgi:hypothetical protein